LVHVIDVPPTVLELAGVAPPKEHDGQPVPPMQGRSFVQALSDAQAAVHEDLWWCHEGHRAVRVGQWKLVAARNTPWELYDLATDRCETNNVAADQPARVAELEAAWNRIADECRTLAASKELDDAGAARHEKRAARKTKAAGGNRKLKIAFSSAPGNAH
jgi:arylsulfatase